MQRRDGDIAFCQCADIRAGFGYAGGGVAANPIVGTVAWVEAFIEAAVIHTQSLTGDAKAFDLVFFQERNVDIEQGVFRQAMCEDVFNCYAGGVG